MANEKRDTDDKSHAAGPKDREHDPVRQQHDQQQHQGQSHESDDERKRREARHMGEPSAEELAATRHSEQQQAELRNNAPTMPYNMTHATMDQEDAEDPIEASKREAEFLNRPGDQMSHGGLRPRTGADPLTPRSARAAAGGTHETKADEKK